MNVDNATRLRVGVPSCAAAAAAAAVAGKPASRQSSCINIHGQRALYNVAGCDNDVVAADWARTTYTT